MALLSILGLGFVLGMRHATDSDHVVAVTTIVSRERSVWSAALIGALWGLGHTLTMTVVGGAIVVFDLVIPARLGLSMELSVGIMLVVLGGLNLSGALRRIDAAAHASAGHHAGDSVDGACAIPASVGRRWTFARWLRPLLVGVVHGLAGSAAVALLVLTTIRKPPWALLYLGVFGSGTVLGMMLLTTAMATPIALAADRYRHFNLRMARITGVLSVAFGMLLLYQIGIVDGLFSSQPHWTPR